MDLITRLQECDKAYYNSETPLMSDDEYDAMRELAKGLYPDHEYFKAIGASVNETIGHKIKFNHVIGSLNKTKPDDGTFEKWLTKVDAAKKDVSLFIMPKLDGASVVCSFFNGKLVWAATRGDGKIGVNITHKLSHIDFMTKTGFTGILRGEVIMRGNDYKTIIRDKNAIGFANRRNGVVGILGNEDNTNNKHLHVMFYEVIEHNGNNGISPVDGIQITSTVDNFIGNNGCIVREVEYCDEFSGASNFLVGYLTDLKAELDYDIDGLVIYPSDYTREDVALPEFKVAFKVNEEPSLAIVDTIEWSVNRQGRITPVVIFKDKVLLSGAMVGRALGFNYKFIKDNAIGEGAVVGIVRSGEVIPYITNIVSPAPVSNQKPLDSCPACGGKVKLNASGVEMMCVDPDNCSESKTAKIVHWLTVLGCENVRESILEKLNIDSLDKLYTITESDIAKVEGFGGSSAELIMHEIRKTLSATPEQFVVACSIPTFGNTATNKVFAKIRSERPEQSETEALADFLNMGYNEFVSFNGIGPKLAELAVNHQQRLYETFLRLYELYGFTLKERSANMSQKMAGKRIAATGEGPIGRKEIEEIIKAEGGTFGGVSKETDILLCADPTSNSSKLQKAAKYGTRIMSYEEFLKEMGVKY